MAEQVVLQRKSISTLSQDELNNFLDAFQTIKSKDIYNLGLKNNSGQVISTYELLAGAHGQPGQYCTHHERRFPVWHRIYVRLFEKALTDAGSKIGLPYLDWFDISNGLPPVLLATNNSLSNYLHQRGINVGGYPIQANDPTHRYPYATIPSSNNRQDVDQYNNNSFETTDVNNFYIQTANQFSIVSSYNQALQATTYANFTFNQGVQPSRSVPLESPHDSCHGLVGSTQSDDLYGDMALPDTAAFDPIFWLHHTFVDYILHLWWDNNHTISVGDFPTDTLANPLWLAFPKGVENFGIFPNIKPVTVGDTTYWEISDQLLAELKNNENTIYVGKGPQPHLIPSSAFIVNNTEYTYTVDRSQIKGSFTIYAKNAEDHILARYFIFNRSDPGCPNCLRIPKITIRLHLQQEPSKFTYILGLHGKTEFSAEGIIEKV